MTVGTGSRDARIAKRLREVAAAVRAGFSRSETARAAGYAQTYSMTQLLHTNLTASEALWPPCLDALERAAARRETAAKALPAPRVVPVFGARAALAGMMALEAARLFGVPVDAVRGPRRHRPIVRARQAMTWALRQRFPALSWYEMARLVGVGDHTTPIHNCRVAEHLRRVDPYFAAACDQLAAIVHDQSSPVPADIALELQRVAERAELAKQTAEREARLKAARGEDDCDDLDQLVASAVAAERAGQARPAAAQKNRLPRDGTIETGSRLLLEALRREHPKRVAA